ncbi:hypothetical protein N9W17_05085 [Jannaschia sp.]|nr:hypothetical protein [Jannaschia sp.]
MIGRGIGAVLAVAMLAGCVAQQAQVVDSSDAASFRVTDVTVEAARAASADPRGFDLGEDQTETLLRGAVLDTLDDLNPAGTRSVTVALDVSRIFVANPATAVVGRSGSVAEATAQLLDARTGAAIGAPFAVSGGTGTRLGGVIGAAITAGTLVDGGQQGEITRIGLGLGNTVAQAVFGTDSGADAGG